MPLKNVEIKARCSKPGNIRDVLRAEGADFKGKDHQTDTYFKVESGRLKLREGSIENNLIYYDRPDTKSPKPSHIQLISMAHPQKMKSLLTHALGIDVVVKKQREIYFINNVKFHIDIVEKLGDFVEIEAIDKDGSISETKLRKQCEYYMQLFDISVDDLVAESYSNLINQK